MFLTHQSGVFSIRREPFTASLGITGWWVNGGWQRKWGEFTLHAHSQQAYKSSLFFVWLICFDQHSIFGSEDATNIFSIGQHRIGHWCVMIVSAWLGKCNLLCCNSLFHNKIIATVGHDTCKFSALWALQWLDSLMFNCAHTYFMSNNLSTAFIKQILWKSS